MLKHEQALLVLFHDKKKKRKRESKTIMSSTQLAEGLLNCIYDCYMNENLFTLRNNALHVNGNNIK